MIVSVKRGSGLSIQGPSPKGASGATAPFKDVLAGKVDPKGQQVAIPTDPFRAMNQLSQRVLKGEHIGSKELLLYQIRAGQFGMRVELTSKVAESVSASVRKLQNQG